MFVPSFRFRVTFQTQKLPIIHNKTKENVLLYHNATLNITVSDNLGISNIVKLVSVTTTFNDDNSLEVAGPVRFDKSIRDFKLDHVLHYKKQGFTVVYIGDSYSDFQAVLGADQIFSVRESKLSTYCKDKKLQFDEFDDFQEVIEILIKNNLFFHFF